MALHATVSDTIPSRVGIYKKEYPPEVRRDGGAEPQSLISVPNISGLNPKSLHSAYDVKVYMLLIAIRLSDGDIKPGDPLGSFRKE